MFHTKYIFQEINSHFCFSHFQIAMSVATSLCLLMTIVCSADLLVINNVTVTVTTPYVDNTVYEDEVFNITVELTLDYTPSSRTLTIDLLLPHSIPTTTTTCDELMTGAVQNCRDSTYSDVYATVDVSTVVATIGNNLVASVPTPIVSLTYNGLVPQAICTFDFGSVYFPSSNYSTDLISVQISTKIRPGFSASGYTFSAIAVIDNGMEQNETSAAVYMRGPLIRVTAIVEQAPYSDVEAGDRVYYSVRIDHVAGSTESAIDGVVCILYNLQLFMRKNSN